MDPLLTILIAALFAFFFYRQFAGKVAPAKARECCGGARLVDVRTPSEFAGGHIDGAVNVPLQDLQSRLGDIGEPARPVVVYCQSGMRSASAARLLKRSGFLAVYDLGGIHRWG